MHRKYNPAYFIFALGLTMLMVGVGARAQIIFVSDRDGHSKEIYVMDADGKNPQNLTNHPAEDWSPSWSPKSEHIAFSSDRDGPREIYVMDTDGGNPRRLTNHPEFDGLPSWSSDGERIAFVSDRGRSFDIYVIDADGGNLQNLTNLRFGEDSAPAWFHPNLGIAPAAVAPTAKKPTWKANSVYAPTLA